MYGSGDTIDRAFTHFRGGFVYCNGGYWVLYAHIWILILVASSSSFTSAF